MPTPRKVELWALQVLERLSRGTFQEDSLVELKSTWIDSAATARRLAGHANAAGGADILWIIGADEKRGVIGAEPRDLSTWLPQVVGCFDGVAPHVVDVQIDFNGNSCVALAFDTTLAPYVVKNPFYGQSGVNISYETPWREGTAVRSARRNDLLLMLSDRAELPDIEVIKGAVQKVIVGAKITTTTAEAMENALTGKRPSIPSLDYKKDWSTVFIHLEMYFMPFDLPLFIPNHRTRTEISVVGSSFSGELHKMRYRHQDSSVYSRMLNRSRHRQQLVIDPGEPKSFEDTGSELIFRQACAVSCEAEAFLPSEDLRAGRGLTGYIQYFIGRQRVPMAVPFLIESDPLENCPVVE